MQRGEENPEDNNETESIHSCQQTVEEEGNLSIGGCQLRDPELKLLIEWEKGKGVSVGKVIVSSCGWGFLPHGNR